MAFNKNLLKNPCGDDGLNFWEVICDGGDRWKVLDIKGDPGCDKFFATSYQLCLKRQVIDLLAEGFTCTQLDAEPTITVDDWYSGRTDCGCVYQWTVCLLDGNQKVLQEYLPEHMTLKPKNGGSWKQVTHSFTEYGAGVRFISFVHGGQDTNIWKGWFGARVTKSSVILESCPKNRNLLKNPSGRDNLKFWEVTKNGGDRWKVLDMRENDFGIFFATSYKLCLKKQVVDLLAEGFTCKQMDTEPTITVDDWYSGRTDCGCVYQWTVCLLDGNLKVLQEYQPEHMTLKPKNGGSWKQVTHSFTEYGAGVRFISFVHGGQDTNFWKGWFGARVTKSSVILESCPKNRNLLKNPSGRDNLKFWEVTKNGGDGWKVLDMRENDFGIFFATSYQLCLKKQVIDLLAEGFTCKQLDTEPTITVDDWYSGRTDCGCVYQLTVCLLDGNLKVLKEFKPKPVTLQPENGGSWKQVTHAFSGYGAGVRFISFEHGGQDNRWWKGWYGVRVNRSSITVEV
ncbi:uncharacterized protein LOC142990939 [Genypterus blacodes]|uniref:uncharacterized protein LOC142990939 n=1 Tax=Genypterus blacodes TaxID=154954 RepID=UPI003F777CDE